MTTIRALAKKVQVRAENAVDPAKLWSPTANVRQLTLLRVSYSQASATVHEGTSLLVTAQLDSAADRPVSVPVTKLGDSGAFRLDNAANDTIAFGLGTTEATFALAALQDADSDNETVTLGFGDLPDGVLLTSPASLVVTIDDDEASNRTPTFNEGATAMRTVAENTAESAAVGAPVAATDLDGDTLTYSLADPVEALFAIDGTTGQITVGSGTALNFEGETTSYALTVQVSDRKDSDGAMETPAVVDATIVVTVNVSDDETEAPSAPGAPMLVPGTTTLDVEWIEPNNDGPRITGYDVFYRVSGETDWDDASFEGTGTSTVLMDLATGTTYEVYVRATNDEGTSDPSPTAEANTLPRVTLIASETTPAIGADNAAVAVTLTATVEAGGGGTLTGAWLEGSTTSTVLQDNVALTSGTAVTREVASATPETRTYGLRVRHELDGRASTTTRDVEIAWRPGVVLGAEPAQITEVGGGQTVTVTATLTGTSQTNAPKTVTVSVGSGTATAGSDFAAVNDFTIAIPGDTRSATGTFTLTPVADTTDEGPETVMVTGTATDGAPLSVVGTTVTIDDSAAQLTVTAPANGYVTGTTGGGASLATVIDCGPSRTDCTAEITDGSTVTLTATADEGYGFSGWTGDCSGTGTCTVTVDADRTVGATFVELPGRPDAPSASPGDHETLTVTWSAPNDPGTGIVGYVVRHSVAGANNWTEAATGDSATTASVTGLAAGTEYDVQVQALAAEGGGLWSDPGQAVTLPEVTVTVDNAFPAIPDGNAKVAVTLTARATAAQGTLTGRWVRQVGEELRTVNGSTFAMTSGRDVTATFRFDSPGTRTYGLQVTHAPNSAQGEVGGLVAVQWLPRVVLSASPTSVIEDGGAETVTVTATLTGRSVEDVAKTVTVTVGSGTATVVEDFAPVNDVTITIPGATRSATGTFVLTPVADTADEGSETVAVTGTATDGAPLTVIGTTVTIDDARPELTVTAPDNGTVTGTTGSGDSIVTVIDCGSDGRTDCTEMPASGTVVTLTATADEGYGFDGWTGDCLGTGTCTLTVDADKTVGATFTARPGQPDAPTATPTDHQTLMVTWSAPSEPGTGIVGYAVRHSVVGANNWTETATGDSATTASVTGLAAGTEYDVQVQALAAEGGGAWSDPDQAVTLPEVTVTVDNAFPAIPDGNAAVAATVTARVTAAQGTLTGRWVQQVGEELRTVNGSTFEMSSGDEYTASFSFATPGTHTYGLMVTHSLNTAHGEVGKVLDIQWLPSAVYFLSPTGVPEDGRTWTVRVTVSLTGTAVEDVAKTVTVQVRGITATAGEDFTAVEDFTIAIPAGRHLANGYFDLTPLTDTVAEGRETLRVGGTAAQGDVALPVIGKTMHIEDAEAHSLSVTVPAKGRITGPGIDCGGTQTDCQAAFADNTSVTLTAVADTDHALDAWTGDCSGRGTCELTMNRDKAVSATFVVTTTIDGACDNTTRNACTAGTPNDAAVGDTATHYKWRCDGQNGGSNSATCEKRIPIDGDCDNATRNGCTAGTPNDGAIADTDTHYKWRCDGLHGGSNSGACEKPLPIDGDCDITTRNGCTAGTSNDAAVEDTATHYKWRCDGSYGGSNSGTCERPIDPIDGECNNATRNGCAAGTPNDAAVGDTATHHKWRCDGQHGGSNSATCEKRIPIDGDCDNATRNGCTAGTPNDGAIADTATHYRWRCDGQYGGGNSRTCERLISTGTDGECDDTRVDGCSAGTLNTTAYADTDTYHQWRCDGINGGADSGRCMKTKPGCSSGSLGWTVGSISCEGPVDAAGSGQSDTATDSGDPTRGSATFKCDDGRWVEQPGSTCSVALRCGPSDFSCLPPGAIVSGRSSTPAVDGACADTEQQRCLDDTVFRNDPDRTRQNGRCSTVMDRCDRGHYSDRTDTEREYRWRCLGIDAENRWSCLGIDGANNWSCSYGSQSVSCSTTENARDTACREITSTATDASCSTCKPCTGDNEELDESTCACPCAPGYERQNGRCELVPPGCEADTATWQTCEGVRRAAEHGETVTVTDSEPLDTGSATYQCDTETWTGPSSSSCNPGCEGEEIDGCTLPDTVHGGMLNGSCGDGYSGSCSYTCNLGAWTAKTTWDADCQGGAANWMNNNGNGARQCNGTVGTTAHGGRSTARDEEPPETGSATFGCSDGDWGPPTSSSCNRICSGQTVDGCTLAAADHGNTVSGTCGGDYTGSCSYACSDDDWTMRKGCMSPNLLTINPVPTLGYVTAAVGLGDGISCGYGGRTNCVELYRATTTVRPSATAKSGYKFENWTGACEGTSCEVEMTEPKTISAAFDDTQRCPMRK